MFSRIETEFRYWFRSVRPTIRGEISPPLKEVWPGVVVGKGAS
jgi:hypothetical protein